ncbi:MAG: hypothetical protein GF330_01485 [Candidatus Eisenbacteria bacterium]|nr:hypothetical protein [Candidatus Eisenbacteria bacterium]
MDDIFALDREYQILTDYLRRCRFAPAQAVATAQFILRIPRDLIGREFYLSELSATLIASASASAEHLTDPGLRRMVHDTGLMLRETGVVSGAAGQELERAITRFGGEAHASLLPRLLQDDQTTGFLLPVVHELPPFSTEENGGRFIGIILPLTIEPLPARPGVRADSWMHHGGSLRSSDLTRLEDVSASAYAAALRSAREQLPRGRGHPNHRPTEQDDRGDDDVRFRIAHPNPELAIAGQSAGLGLAVAFAGAMLGRQQGDAARKPAADYAWSGRVLPSGEVAAIRSDSLRAKVRAAYFSRLRGIVIPQGNLEDARAALPAGARPFEIHGVRRVSDALGQPELCRAWSLPAQVLADPPRRLSPIARGLLVGASALAVVLLGGALFDLPVPLPSLLQPESQVAEAHLSGERHIALRDGRGEIARVLELPAEQTQPLKDVLLFRPTSDARPSIVGWTHPDESVTPCRIIGWNPRGTIEFEIPATGDTPFLSPTSDMYLNHARKQFHYVLPAGNAQIDVPALVAIEAAHRSSSVLRVFSFRNGEGSPRRPREQFRFYHRGHIASFRFSEDFSGDGKWLWMIGPLNDERIIEAGELGSTTTHFLACVPYGTDEVHVSPPHAWVAPEFRSAHGAQLTQGRELFYFALRGYVTHDDRVDWRNNVGMKIESLLCSRDEGFHTELLTRTNLLVMMDFESASNVTVDLSMTGELVRVLGLRAARQGVEAGPMIESFLADSVFYLVHAREDLEIQGQFTDLRPRIAALGGHDRDDSLPRP